VVLNAVDAAERGATVRTRTRCVRAERGETWKLVLEVHGRPDLVNARALVNATGPWVGMFNEAVLHQPPLADLRLVAGSHIVVPRLFDHDRAYIFQAADGRVVFALPFEDEFTLVGTTDREFSGDPAAAAATPDEVAYLCGIVNDRFRMTVTPNDVVWSFAGVRPLYGDESSKPQDTPRDYALALDRAAGEAPLLTVYGGKITTYRRLAEEAYERLAPVFGARPDWTARAALPGGDVAVDGIARLAAETRAAWPFLSERHVQRLVRAYGTRVRNVLAPVSKVDDLGPGFGADLTGAEVDYLMRQEWARSADDVLWRRSKLGLKVTREDRARLATYMANAVGGRAS
jgi:glycerol-3-phosphate dehydrogenase